ncbi:MAG: NAD(+)/NADH kinase, partial [Bdellovibrionales bacterium]|nr:NAD(+)/NADH kinase [Oligoflexia bacterium]
MKKILLLINPYSRSGQSAENALLFALKEAQHTIVNTVPLLENASFNDLIRHHRLEADLVLIGGGDGSMNEALEALVETQLPLLVFPQGTANNLARTFAIPREIPEIVKMVNEAKLIKVDLGSVNGIYFINVAGLGLSAKINRSVSSSTKRFFGVFAFFASAFTAFFRMNTFHAKITTIEHGKETSVQVKSWQI